MNPRKRGESWKRISCEYQGHYCLYGLINVLHDAYMYIFICTLKLKLAPTAFRKVTNVEEQLLR
jgi:hypothetical protein